MADKKISAFSTITTIPGGPITVSDVLGIAGYCDDPAAPGTDVNVSFSGAEIVAAGLQDLDSVLTAGNAANNDIELNDGGANITFYKRNELDIQNQQPYEIKGRGSYYVNSTATAVTGSVIHLSSWAGGHNGHITINSRSTTNGTLQLITATELQINLPVAPTGAVDEEAKKVGDWYPFFKGLIESVEALNYFYGLLGKTFKITDSLFVFPNLAIKEALQLMLDNESLLTSSATIGETVSIIQIMTSILQTINYQMLFPASYTYTHSLVQKDTAVPIRAYFLPDIKWGPPLKNNIIFPSQTESVSYTRHMSSEPTRLMAGTPPFDMKDSQTGLDKTKAWFLAPGLNFVQVNNSSEEAAKFNGTKGLIADEYVLSFSPEESYRGVKAETTGLQGLEDSFIKNL